MPESCPDCGTPRVGSYRYCAACRLDFEPPAEEHKPVAPSLPAAVESRSYTERFAGTEWGTPPLEPAPAPPPRTIRWWLPVVAIAGLVALAAAGLVAVETAATDIRLSREVTWVLLVAVPLVGGKVSTIVPGRKARGWFKGSIVGFVGWFVFALAAVLLTKFRFPASIDYARGAVDQIICAVLGASILRLILWPLG